MPDQHKSHPSPLLPLLLGIAVTLVIRGYQFGGGNHSVYLVAPLRQVHPELLANDWWTTKTLQYHVVFTNLTAGLMKLGIERPAFATMCLALVLLMHLAWLRLALRLGFDAGVYLFSILLYYLSAGGTALGSYQFLQDSSFLPGNVANVAMLWALVWWIEGRSWPAAVGFALAGLFHLNHALAAIGFWAIAIASSSLSRTRPQPPTAQDAHPRAGEGRGAGRPQPLLQPLAAFLLITLFALPNIIPAVRITLAAADRLPLNQFVQLYVKLRHPHHYDPLSWHIALWLSFLWPIPLACLTWRRTKALPEIRRATFAFLFFCAIMTVALIFAGVLFVSESLIQMSLFRFSIYPKLLSCVGAAAFLLNPQWLERPTLRRAPLMLPGFALIALIVVRLSPASQSSGFVQDNLTPLLLFIAFLTAGVLYVSRQPPHAKWLTVATATLLIAVPVAAWRNHLGLRIATHDRADADYLAMCHWVRQNTPTDAVFLIPPNEQLFRFHARRAIVVNFKGVPQLSSELDEWRRRMEAVLDLPLSNLPQRFDHAHDAIQQRYNDLPPTHLRQVARQFNARYVLTNRPTDRLGPAVFESTSCHLYDLAR